MIQLGRHDIQASINPPEPTNPHEEHDFEGAPDKCVVDGPGKEEVNAVEDTVVSVIYEMRKCRNQPCAAVERVSRIVTVDMDDLCDEAEVGDWKNVRQTDYNEITFECGICGEEHVCEAEETQRDLKYR